MLIPTVLLALATTPKPVDLHALVAALATAKAWQADFVQEYIPAGFESGTTEHGTVTIEPPIRLRFEYAGTPPRVFALDGSVARNVDPGAGTCDAVRIDAGAWSRLPLAALLDPAAAASSFTITAAGDTLHLVPRTPSTELATIDIRVDPERRVRTLDVVDADGNHNRFSFSSWRHTTPPPEALFRPSLPGAPPCKPEGS